VETRTAHLAPDWNGAPAGAEQRQSLRAELADHFRDREYVPDTLELAGSAFALQPSLAQRLNRLAGVSPGSGYLSEAVEVVRRMYATLMGVDENERCTQSELAQMGHYVMLGAVAGVVAIVLMSMFSLRRQELQWFFAPVLGVLSIALGVAIVPRATRKGAVPGRVGYVAVLAAMAMSTTAGIGCNLGFWGDPPLYDFSTMMATAFVPVLLVVSLAAAVFVRLSPAIGLTPTRPETDEGAKTAHTVMMLLKDEHEKKKGHRPNSKGSGKERQAE
jgi:hypothetical protein